MFQISISSEELSGLPLRAFPGEIGVIDSVGKAFDEAMRYLERQTLLGFDTETRPSFSPDQPHYGTALLQLSGPKKCFLFRINKMGVPPRLCRLLSKSEIIKVGAAILDDIRGLQKVHGFTAGGFVDLQKEVWQYGILDKSVKKMTAIILGYKISKTQQLSNWEASSLSDAQMRYAATDAWVCREMFLALMKQEKHPLPPEVMNPPQKEEKAEKKPKAETVPADKPKKRKRKNRPGSRQRRRRKMLALNRQQAEQEKNNG